MRDSNQSRTRRRASRGRRGLATLWLILVLPLMLIAACFALETANLWLARMELEDALEAAALAAVEEWGTTNNNFNARQKAVAFAAVNSVRGTPVTLADNYDVLNFPNNNLSMAQTASLVFGTVDTTYNFDAGLAPDATCVNPDAAYGVYAYAEVEVPMICSNIFGCVFGPFTVKAKTLARYDCTVASPCPTLVRMASFSP